MGETIHFNKIVDRACCGQLPIPSEEYMQKREKFIKEAYFPFCAYQRDSCGTILEAFEIGSKKQFSPQYDRRSFRKNFEVYNIAANGYIHSGKGRKTVCMYDEDPEIFDENMFSCVVLFTYGKFTYYNGGDLGSGPYNIPYRPSPLSFTVDGTKYYTERPTSTQQTGFSFVGQMRSAYPDAIGGVIWWTNDDANMTAYTPIYCGVSAVPQCYERIEGEQDELTFSWKSAFWLCNTVSNMVYPYYEKMMPDLQAAQQELETAFAKEQLRVDTEARTLMDESADRAIAYLTDYSQGAADRMMDRWNVLFKYLVVKHNDMVVKAEENGHFKRTQHGFGAAPTRPGYPERYWREVVKQTGDRYLMK